MVLDFPTIALLWLTGSLILLPLMILAVRFAVIPLIATVLHPAGSHLSGSDSARIARLEERVGRLTSDLERLARTASGQPNG